MLYVWILIRLSFYLFIYSLFIFSFFFIWRVLSFFFILILLSLLLWWWFLFWHFVLITAYKTYAFHSRTKIYFSFWLWYLLLAFFFRFFFVDFFLCVWMCIYRCLYFMKMVLNWVGSRHDKNFFLMIAFYHPYTFHSVVFIFLVYVFHFFLCFILFLFVHLCMWVCGLFQFFVRHFEFDYRKNNNKKKNNWQWQQTINYLRFKL